MPRGGPGADGTEGDGRAYDAALYPAGPCISGFDGDAGNAAGNGCTLYVNGAAPEGVRQSLQRTNEAVIRTAENAGGAYGFPALRDLRGKVWPVKK